MTITELSLRLMEYLGDDLIYFSCAKGVAKVTTVQGTFIGKDLDLALREALNYRSKIRGE